MPACVYVRAYMEKREEVDFWLHSIWNVVIFQASLRQKMTNACVNIAFVNSANVILDTL